MKSLCIFFIPILIAQSLLFVFVNGGIQNCPEVMYRSGRMNDLGMLADHVSQNISLTVAGVCDNFTPVVTCSGNYSTRLRLYESMDGQRSVLVFRPTQSSGGDIHNERKLVPVTFLSNDGVGIGMVHDRFQQAFLSIMEDCRLQGMDWSVLKEKKLYIGSHSLGGSLNIFMTIYLWKIFQIIPEISLGLAGPFIGDLEFTITYQLPLKSLIPIWFQVEDKNWENENELDGTVMGYNVPNPPFIYQEIDVVCLLMIHPLPTTETYGMHDLKNYRQGLKGQNCTIFA